MDAAFFLLRVCKLGMSSSFFLFLLLVFTVSSDDVRSWFVVYFIT